MWGLTALKLFVCTVAVYKVTKKSPNTLQNFTLIGNEEPEIKA